MSTRRRVLLGLAAAMSITAAACSDASRPTLTAPDRIESQAQNLVETLTELLIAPVTRTTALAEDVVWSFSAGPNGGFTYNANVGLSVAVPPGALDRTVRITVTALKGKPVAYRFEPHLEFDRKVHLTQDLRGTSVGLVSGLVLKGAHFPGDAPTYTEDGLAVVDEIVGAFFSVFTKTVTFGVDHFTGWLVASGNSRE